MTITITRPCALLHTTGRDLKALFDVVLAHASCDEDDLPELDQLHIEVCDGDLRLVCTDRHTMAIVRQPLESTTEGFTCAFAVSCWHIRHLVKALSDKDTVTVAIEANRLLVTIGDELHTIPGEESHLPWRKALARHLAPTSTPTGRLLINPALLARLAPARALYEDVPLQVQMHGERGAVIATLADRVLVLVMPMHNNGRLSERALPSRPFDGWFDLLDESWQVQ
ncbi:hypothetical protein ACIBCT_37470 [Streptosporangium sp. NPDC050855]|uniref:hypothetical protein n=1 Tax=Streptosporangium sp. NPDC050855 TaxID=3366194 RepID=UPI0037961B41